MKSSKRGFAVLIERDPERQRAIASQGGKAAHQHGVAHIWTQEEAKRAGKKGGIVVSQDKKHMKEIGRKGGTALRVWQGNTTKEKKEKEKHKKHM